MRKLLSSFWLFLFIVLFSACTERVSHSYLRTIHLYSDILSSEDEDLFHQFEKQNQIDVRIHCMPFSQISKRLESNRYASNIDMIVLGEPRDFIRLKQNKYLYTSPSDEEIWQPVALDPLVFIFENDSTQNFTTYGQIARGDLVLLLPSLLLKQSYLEETVTDLQYIYKDFSKKVWQQKIKQADSLIPKKTEIVRWVFHSELKPSDFRYGVYPDQHYLGAVGKSLGVGIIHNNPNLQESLALYEWCRDEKWRRKFAKRLKVFEIITNDGNKERYPYLYQNFTINRKK